MAVRQMAAMRLILRSAWFKGRLGEFQVNFGVRLLLDRGIYRLIKNVTLPVGDGTTQIDQLVISSYGIFVIETKNMKGWIFGSRNQAQWTQQIYRYKQKFQTHSDKTTHTSRRCGNYSV